MTIQPTTREYIGHGFPHVQETGKRGKCCGCGEIVTQLFIVPRLTGPKDLCAPCVNELAVMFGYAEADIRRHMESAT